VLDLRQRIIEVILGCGPGAEQRFAINILIAFLPAVVFGLLFHHVIKTYLFNPLTVAGP